VNDEDSRVGGIPLVQDSEIVGVSSDEDQIILPCVGKLGDVIVTKNSSLMRRFDVMQEGLATK
jgi:hypothetical protein